MSVSVRTLTASGRGGISVLEVRGAQAAERLGRLAAERLPAAGTFALMHLRDAQGELLDQALVLRRASDAFELHLHANPLVVDRVTDALVPEPSQAAVASANVEERARRLLPTAPSEAAARMLLDQAEGALRRGWSRLDPAAASFDAELAQLLERGRVARFLLEPPRVVLAGPVNAGKSTLFNALVGTERVVVSAEEGTTRDAVHERVLLGAYAVELIDTAGERTLPGDQNLPERAGQELGRSLRAAADLVLWLVPAQGPRPRAGDAAAAGSNSLVLLSKADEGEADGACDGTPALSVLRDPEGARASVAASVRRFFDLPVEPWEAGSAVPFEDGIRAGLGELAVARGVQAARDLHAKLGHALLDGRL